MSLEDLFGGKGVDEDRLLKEVLREEADSRKLGLNSLLRGFFDVKGIIDLPNE